MQLPRDVSISVGEDGIIYFWTSKISETQVFLEINLPDKIYCPSSIPMGKVGRSRIAFYFPSNGRMHFAKLRMLHVLTS